MRFFLSILFFTFILTQGHAQGVWMHPNKGQWDKEIEYSVELSNGQLYIDQKGFTYFLNNALSHNDHTDEEANSNSIQCQVIKTHFESSTWKGKRVESDSSSFYRNYFIGNDQGKWKSNVHSVQKTILEDYYTGIDLVLDGTSEKLKYSFIVSPGVDPSTINYSIKGSENVTLIDGALHISTRFGEIIEEKPIAWTEKEGRRTEVHVEFLLNDNQVQFNFPKGYDRNETLVIDPYLVFSTFTGSTADNWGMTATPDTQGNLYGGGIVFSNGGTYPTTAGTFDMTLNGGDSYIYTFGGGTYNMSGFDIGISKFSSDGSALLFSTYLGGTGNEAPHSLVTDENDNLFVFGVTGSANFPIIPGCYDVSFNGGPFVAENELGYYGSDLYVTRFNAAGSALIGSTFVGGTGTDGINIGALNFNYGDPFRGEIIVKNGFVYVSSTTQSSDFPTVGAAQGTLNGIQDAVIFKMNSNLTTMPWSTYFGGSGLESGNSLQVSSMGNVYVAGGTNSATLPITNGNDLSFNGGISDGYLLKIQGGTSMFVSGTFMGMSEYDQAYFVQLDDNDDVYTYGQSESEWPITAGVYGNANSGQFIRKYSNNLATILWTTMIGAGSGHPEISPTAFLVSECFDIYISGWGGTINSSYSNQAIFSSTNGFPVTSDAYQSTTNGSNFYLAVLGQDAAILKYATYMGGSASSYNHVDGGTSRFDKSGRIYHAVCGACGGNDYGFTSTPGVWSETNNSTNCNLAAFKFELNPILAIISQPEPYICLPDPVIFNSNSANGNSYLWDFGDGATSTDVNPSHLYLGPGDYIVTLVVSDSNGCFTPDTVEIVVFIGDFQGGVIIPTFPVCPGEPYQLEAYGGAFYSWTPANVLDDPTSPTPNAIVYGTTDFTVVVSDSCGSDTLEVTLPVYSTNPDICNDTSICIGGSVMLSASGGGAYLWSPSATLSDPFSPNPIATPIENTEYFVEITTVDGCVENDSVNVSVFIDFPDPIMPDTLNLCKGLSLTVNVSGGDTYVWTPNYQISNLNGPSVVVSPLEDYTYYCTFTNACGSADDSVFINVLEAQIFAGNDTIICPGESAIIWASGGLSYNWTPSTTLNNPFLNQVIATPNSPTVYNVVGVDSTGCSDTASVFINLFPKPYINAFPDVYAVYGDEVQLGASSSTPGLYTWSPAEFLSCVNCPNPIANPNTYTTYTVSYIDENGCLASDAMHIYYDPIIYVPNTFTPDGNEFNNGFQVVASNIESFELLIFDRWGELIYTMNSLDDYWDGTYKGLKCQDGTYVWKLEYGDFLDGKYLLTGHVNLIR